LSVEDWTGAKVRIKEALSIVSVVEAYFPLRRSGKNFTALCPFHKEKTPSFTVFPESDTFRCFGCGKGGDIFTFVQEMERVSFPEAMEILARRAGISLEKKGSAPGRGLKSRLLSILEAAQDFYARSLKGPQGRPAREYLERRGLSRAVEAFGLGFAPPSWTALVEKLGAMGVEPDLLVKAGLAKKGDLGVHDYFRNRLMIPIRDALGRIVGFGGRVLDDSEPKYLNSPENTLFSKGKLLFGLHQARKSGADRFLVVEGYTDVMAAVLAGVKGVVAGLGTSFTADQARLLQRYGRGKVVLLFDGDQAGWKAAERALDLFVTTQMDVRVALLRDGTDPADLVRDRGGRALEEIADSARPALKVKLDLVFSRNDPGDPAGAAQAAREITDYLAKVPDPVRLEKMLQEAASRLGVSQEALAGALRAATRRDRRRRKGPAHPAPQGELLHKVRSLSAVEVQAQEEILWAVLHDLSLLGEVSPEVFRDPGCRRILEGIYKAVETMGEEGSFPWETLLDAVRDDQSLVDKIAYWRNVVPPAKDFSQWVKQNDKTLRGCSLKREIQALEEELRRAKEAGDRARVLRFRRGRYDLIRRLKLEFGMGMEE